MNTCPACQRSFNDGEAAFCPVDATRLVASEQVAIPADPSDSLIGQTIAGRYEMRRIVADGGMGRVYEARQLDIQKRVAVKVLHPGVASERVNIERFRREAETSRGLPHEHIVDVVDFSELHDLPGRPGSTWYLVMEYLDGEELRAVLNHTPNLSTPRILRIIAQSAIALDGAHAEGIVHRDLKPENIFLVRDASGDNVKILDFGSVKFTKGQDRGNKLTVMGTTIGSPFYMSPEQAKGLPDLDGRTDVWAVGAMLYEMSVGKLPFTGPNGPQILFKILGQEPELPSMANEHVAPQLDDIIVKALSKERDKRYATCGALADDLGAAFGLTGGHRSWAHLPERELAKRVGSAVPSATPAFPASAPAEAPAPAAAKKAPVGLYVGIALGVIAAVAGVAFAMHH